MEYIHIKNLEKYHPGYKDRTLLWCKIYFNMLNADPTFEMIGEIDKWRFIAFIILELQAKKPIPIDEGYLIRKGFDLKKRPITATIQVLHNFLDIVNGIVEGSTKTPLIYSTLISSNKSDPNNIDNSNAKEKHLDFVYLTAKEYQTLCDLFGKAQAEALIEKLNNYLGSKGKKYKSHYYTILNWAGKDGIRKQVIQATPDHIKDFKEPNREEMQKVSALVQETISKMGRRE